MTFKSANLNHSMMLWSGILPEYPTMKKSNLQKSKKLETTLHKFTLTVGFFSSHFFPAQLSKANGKLLPLSSFPTDNWFY